MTSLYLSKFNRYCSEFENLKFQIFQFNWILGEISEKRKKRNKSWWVGSKSWLYIQRFKFTITDNLKDLPKLWIRNCKSFSGLAVQHLFGDLWLMLSLCYWCGIKYFFFNIIITTTIISDGVSGWTRNKAKGGNQTDLKLRFSEYFQIFHKWILNSNFDSKFFGICKCLLISESFRKFEIWDFVLW